MKTARIEVNLEPELLAQVEDARGDVARQRWITRAIEERLQAEGFELDLNEEPAEVVPIRPGIKPTVKRAPSKPSERKRRAPAAGTWGSKRR